MSLPDYLHTPHGRRIAYHQSAGTGPGVVFLGGFNSDMGGTKATYLQDWAERTGRAYLRFDYSGHGDSSEKFEDGCIGHWAEDAACAISELTEGPQILVGSSMGGWISLLMTQRITARVAGLVTIAAAPDFTEDSMWDSFTDTQRAEVMEQGVTLLPSEYGDPYPITRRMIEDGRNQLVLRSPLPLPFPVRFLQGTDDADVDMSVALRLLDHATGPDMRLTLVKGADHRFSDPEELGLITAAIEEILTKIAP
ncbi:alpha/beta hydrolase [Thalassobius vesicularis]|uniref:Palmitoyl-protein thioesterase ABHD10, mitochondrial n=1 Tax=Thalassobius vesicularis TaxID=1294297 RepID=A0A4S3MB05_9RHOB|nr:alpha/beta hydrolase [Thalassobius vesicularis]THD75757.1 alpha/beta hydrolase [Thalassobius vesicularis]